MSIDDAIHAIRDHNYVRSVLRNTKNLPRAIQNKRRGMVISRVALLHDIARPHKTACTPALLEHFNWE
jgi:hypothetical protein